MLLWSCITQTRNDPSCNLWWVWWCPYHVVGRSYVEHVSTRTSSDATSEIGAGMDPPDRATNPATA